MQQILTKIKAKIKTSKVIVTCSTGVDSSVLLEICLKALNKEQIIVAFVNHKMRSEADLEEAYLKDYAKQLGLILECHTLDIINHNFEEQARQKRYEFFYQLAVKYQAKYILLAHHADDNLETMLMRLIKGASIEAYAGMKEETKFKDIYLYRPFLQIPKSKILQYANTNNIKYFNDVTNESNIYLRNKIRNEIIPIMRKINPSLYDAVNYYNYQMIEGSKLIEAEVDRFIVNNVVIKDDIVIKNMDNLTNNEFLGKQILFKILKPFRLSRYQIDEIMKIIISNKNNIQTPINPNLNLIKEYGMLIFTTRTLQVEPFSLKINEDGTYKLPNNQTITIIKNNCYFTTGNKKLCYNILGLPLTIRNRKIGDKIRRKSKTGTYHQSVSDILTNQKVPYLDRLATLVVVNEQNEVIIILGLTIS